MSRKEKNGEGCKKWPLATRVPEELHENMARISAATGWSMSGLLELGAQLLVKEVRQKGSLPMPEIKLDEEVAA